MAVWELKGEKAGVGAMRGLRMSASSLQGAVEVFKGGGQLQQLT